MKRRIIATILSLALIFTQVPWTALNVSAQTTLDIVSGSKISDPDTTDDWKNYFGETGGNISTQYAGGVWTDKSVFTDSLSFDDNDDGTVSPVMSAGENNFLIAESAISSTKQISGYSYLPTDTVLVLDTSGSMTDDDLRAMVTAANDAITKLYETSNYNRVGIAVYNLNSYTLMPIDRYTKTGTNWLKFRKNGNTRYIDVESGVKDSDGNTFTASVAGRSGTYTQGGMQEGLSLFKDVEDTVIETGNIQGGTIRIPVMVLMTDGDPTSGSSIYHNATNDNRNIGRDDYSTTNAELVFLTQLTAANVHNEMEKHYGRECLFYTLGLGVSGEYAPQMLQPETTGTATAGTIDNYWASYATKQNYEAEGAVAANCFIAQYTGRTERVNIYRRTTAEVGNALIASRYYSDGYFTASNSAGLITAFEEIVQEIILQSKYYPTLVTTGQYDMDGYVTLVDELGEYMEVKDIKGLVYNDKLYSGQALIEAMYGGTYGNAGTWTALGWELVYSIRERLDVAATGDNTDDDGTADYGTPITLTNGVVTNLLSQAWDDGQIHGEFDGSGNMTSFSNYISYYVNARGQYLGFHDKEHTETDWPAGTKYIGRSYIFSGNITGSASSIAAGEMMHIVVQVYEDVTNGHQTVTWRIPASLIPTVMYEISVNGDQLTETTVDEIKYTGDTPIRLVYEVGLNDELTPVNIVEKLTAEGAHAHPTADGGYYFYSNRWGNGHGVTELDPNNHKATVAHYSPSVENERYYYTEDTILYINVNGSYVPYTGSARPADMYPNDNTTSGFFHPIKVVSGAKSSTGADATLSTTWLPVAASVLNDVNVTKQTTDGTNQWYVAKGTIYQQTARDRVAKTQNTTETLEYVDYPVIAHPTGETEAYEVFLFHGNNGRLKVMPGTGLKVTKEVTEASQETGADNNFKFVITLSEAVANPKVTKPDYSDYAVVSDLADVDDKYEYHLSDDGKTITLILVDGETVYITGLANGTTYTVTENDNIYYKLESVTAETVDGTAAKGTVAAAVIDDVTFVNTAASFKGDLQITKTVTHPYGDDYVIPANDNTLFDVVVTLKDSGGNAITDFTGLEIEGTQNRGTAITAFPVLNADNTITFRFGHEDSVTIRNLPHGATYEVREDLPSGSPFSYSTSTGLAGTIVTDQTAYAHLINNYTPVYETSEKVNVYITKNLEGISWAELAAGSSFTFRLEKYEPTTQTWVDTGRQLAVTRNDADPAATVVTAELPGASAIVPFNYLGTHYYRLSEVAGSIAGVTYDATHAYFRVIVTDSDMDGKTEIEVVAANNTTVDTRYDAVDPALVVGYDVKAAFTNRYNSTTANINIHKNLVNNTGVDVPMDSFTFELLDSGKNPVLDALGNPVVVTPNVNGDVIIPITYTSSDVTAAPKKEETTYADLDGSVPYVETSETEATRTGTVTATEVVEKELVETYYLKETTGSMAGMTYDNSEISVEVTVTVFETTEYDVTKVVNYTRSKLPVYEQKVENGEPVFDEYGNPVYVQKVENGEPVFDEYDNPVYVQQTDGLGNPVWTYTEWVQNGEPAVTGTKPSTATPVVTLTNTVKYNGDAALTAAQFNNEYRLNPAKATISGTKVYNRDIAADQFTFNLYETDNTFTVAPGAAVKATATVAGGAATEAFSFAEITYDKAGTYYYVVKEAIPAEATAANHYTVNGVTYDTTVYHVTIVVSRDGATENLIASAPVISEVGGSGTEVEFTNSYSITSGTSAVLTVNKALTGRALNKDEFTFYLYDKTDYETNGAAATVIQTAHNSAYNTVNGTTYTGTVVFETIPYTDLSVATHEYVIVEDVALAEAKGGVSVTSGIVYATVVLKDNGDGTIAVEKIDYSNAATITNNYTTTAASAKIAGKKLYADNATNAAKAENETFTFALFEADKDYNPQSTACAEVAVTSATGKFSFEFNRSFTQAGDYYFVLKELTGSDPTIAYDTKTYNVSVIVRDNGEGALIAVTRIFLNGTDVTGDMSVTPDNSFNTEYAFNNIYYPQEVNTSVHVNKVVQNTTGVQLDNDGFRFGLYWDAELEFPVYLYNGKYIKVDTENGEVVPAGAVHVTDLTDENGNAYIPLRYTDSDMPANHAETLYNVYYLAEMYADRNDDFTPDVIGGMEYDQTIYQVKVDVAYKNGVLESATTLQKYNPATGMPYGNILDAAEYTNTYNLTEAKFSVTAEKNLTGRDPADGEFSFALYNATVNSQGAWEKGAQVGTNVGNIGNNVTFEQQTYSKVGEYYYIAEEVIPADADKLKGVEYDTAQYQIVVTVTDNGQGALVAEVTEITEINGTTATAANKVVFNNTFTPDPIEVEIKGEKKLNNRAPLEGEFTFAIYAADANYNIVGNALATTTNAADGTFAFTNAMINPNDDPNLNLLIFDTTETRRFVVKEVVPANADPTITYSTFEHNIEVAVTERADGQLTYTIKDHTGTTLDLIIENTYTPKNTTATISIEKTLVNETGVNPGVSVKDFTFGLYTNEACTAPYTRNGNHVKVSMKDDGNFDSNVINIPYTDASYKAATSYVYYLKEIIPANPVEKMTYDKSVYRVDVELKYVGTDLVAETTITKVRDEKGNQIAQANQTAVTTASFNNVYDLGSTSITLEGTKVYEGWTNVTNNTEFTFELYQTGVSGNYAATGSQLIGTATAGKTNPNFTFTSVGATDITTDNKVPQLSFTKAGTYYFAVREDKGGLTLVENGHGIIYSGTQYVVAVKVSENVVNGKVTGLKAEKVVYHFGNRPEGLDEAASFEGFTSDNIRFTNIDLDGKATIDFVGKKVVTENGSTLTEDEMFNRYDQAFDFVLYEAKVNDSTWTLVDSKPDTTAVDPMLSTENREINPEDDSTERVNKDYNIEFLGVPLEYAGDGSHTYHFVVKELNSGHPTIGYDPTEYRITVTAAFTTDGTGTHNYIVTSVVVNGKNVSFTTVNENTVVLLKDNSDYAFSNTYTTYSAKATIPVEKTLVNTTGVGKDASGFEFGVYVDDAATPAFDLVPYKENGQHVTVKTAADGKATIELNYTDKDASVVPYVYYIKEIEGTTPGMEYSKQLYKAEVIVAFDTTNGTKLVATPVLHTVDPATGTSTHLLVNRAEFENVYSLAPATLEGFTGRKVIDSRVINSYEYRFELYKAALTQPGNTVVTDADNAWVKGDLIEVVANTEKSDVNAKDYDVFRFSDLKFDKAGVYHYILVEQKGAESSIYYDLNAYQITVTVAPSTTAAKLEAEVADVKQIKYAIDNSYLDAEKEYVGFEEKDSAGNNLSEDDFVFTNIYRPWGTFTVEGEKVLENREWRTGDEFTFEIYYAESDGTLKDAYKKQDGVNPMLSKTVKYNDQGEYSFSFKDIIVTHDAGKNSQIGTQYFVIREKAENKVDAVTYDTNQYLVRVDKKDNGDGTLAVGKYDGTTFTENEFVVTKLDGASNPVLGPTDKITFVNEYNTQLIIPADAVITGKKILENANIADYKNEFTFELYKADSNWNYDSVADFITYTTNDQYGSFEFDNSEFLTFEGVGVYHFIVKERKGTNPAMSYDDSEYRVTITVSEVLDVNDEDGDGDTTEILVKNNTVFLETKVNVVGNKLEFTNSYNPAPFTININKTIEFRNGASHPLNGFVFEVYDVERDRVYNPTTDAAGKTYFSCTFTERDLGANNSPKVYTYIVKEVYTGIEGMKYDKSKYEIQVEVYADNGFIRTEVTQQGVYLGLENSTEVNFENKYSGPEVPTNPDPGTPVIVPDTGDTTDNMLYISLMAISAAFAVVIFLIGKKRREEETEA